VQLGEARSKQDKDRELPQGRRTCSPPLCGGRLQWKEQSSVAEKTQHGPC